MFFKKAVAFTKRYGICQKQRFYRGVDIDGDNIPDIQWFGIDGKTPSWNDPEARTLCYMLDGSEKPSMCGDYQLFFILNADYKTQNVKLPRLDGKHWRRVIDTSLGAGEDFLDDGNERIVNSSDSYVANPRSTVVLLSR